MHITPRSRKKIIITAITVWVAWVVFVRIEITDYFVIGIQSISLVVK